MGLRGTSCSQTAPRRGNSFPSAHFSRLERDRYDRPLPSTVILYQLCPKIMERSEQLPVVFAPTKASFACTSGGMSQIEWGQFSAFTLERSSLLEAGFAASGGGFGCPEAKLNTFPTPLISSAPLGPMLRLMCSHNITN